MTMNEALERAYLEIGDLTPMMHDCGALCGAACCLPDEDGRGGVTLFPCEREAIGDAAWGHIEGDMLICDGSCDRARRPLGCRIFPLAPVRGKNGLWTVRMDARARAMCPLTRSGLSGLDPAFVKAVKRALRIVAETEEGDRFLEAWYAAEQAFRKPLW